MLGQLRVEPELELEEPEPFELDELEEPELVLLDPVFELLELDDDGVVVEELVLELDPVVPVLDVLVVAALATSAPPVTRPVVSAPTANACRNRSFMDAGFLSCDTPPRSERHSHVAPRTCGQAHNDRSVVVVFPDDRVTIHRRRAWPKLAHSASVARPQRRRSR
jgi:hypothetical protein